MWIIEIKALPNGAHRNQSGDLIPVPEGWAIIPADMEIPETFPFVDFKVEDKIVVAMTAGVKPEPDPEPEAEPTADDILKTMLGVSANE